MHPLVQQEEEAEDGSKRKVTTHHVASYPAWEIAIGSKVAGAAARRTSKLYFVVQGTQSIAA
jgi:hypothetical protein